MNLEGGRKEDNRIFSNKILNKENLKYTEKYTFQKGIHTRSIKCTIIYLTTKICDWSSYIKSKNP